MKLKTIGQSGRFGPKKGARTFFLHFSLLSTAAATATAKTATTATTTTASLSASATATTTAKATAIWHSVRVKGV